MLHSKQFSVVHLVFGVFVMSFFTILKIDNTEILFETKFRKFFRTLFEIYVWKLEKIQYFHSPNISVTNIIQCTKFAPSKKSESKFNFCESFTTTKARLEPSAFGLFLFLNIFHWKSTINCVPRRDDLSAVSAIIYQAFSSVRIYTHTQVSTAAKRYTKKNRTRFKCKSSSCLKATESAENLCFQHRTQVI